MFLIYISYEFQLKAKEVWAKGWRKSFGKKGWNLKKGAFEGKTLSKIWDKKILPKGKIGGNVFIFLG